MRRRLFHPLWVHIPALAVLLGMIAYKHGWFGNAGRPSGVLVLAALGAFYISLSAYGDELWARQESRKCFNWLSLFDEALVGFMAVSMVGRHGLWMLLVPICAVGAAIVLELMRPYWPTENRTVAEDTSALRSEIELTTAQGKTWTYWDVQNPAWMNWILLASVVILAGPAVPTISESPVLAALMLLLAAATAGLYGGIHTSVTPEKIEVRFGLYRVSRVRTADIVGAELHRFSPLREFGGYGIRYGGGIKAYFLRGNLGVLLTSNKGAKYLIGSDHPERLAAAIQAAVCPEQEL